MIAWPDSWYAVIFFLFLRHHERLALGPDHDAIDRFVAIDHLDDALVAARREQRRFVEQVLQIRAGESGRAFGERLQRDFLAERLVARVHFENLLAAFEIGAVDDDLPVEAAGTQQRGIEHVGPVRRGDQNDAGVLIEPVHLDEQLVERLFALVVPAAEAGAALAADRVDLVDEDDARRRLLRLIEQIADARGADADEHLDEVGAGDRKERHARLAGDRAREQRLTGSGRPQQQHAFGDARAERLETSCGYFRNSTISPSSSFASSTPATSANVTFGRFSESIFARERPNDNAWLPPLCACLKMMNRNIARTMNGRNPRIDVTHVPLFGLSQVTPPLTCCIT